MKRFTRTKSYGIIILALTVLAAALIVAARAEAASDNSGVSSAELRIGVQTLPDTLDANASVSNAGIQVYYNIYDTLIMRDTSSETLAFKPGLALEWLQTEETVWEIKLRPNVKFHDGTDMTAEDAAYSLNRVIAEEDPAYVTSHNYLLANFKNFEATGPLTLRAYTFRNEPLIEHLLSDPNVGVTSRSYVEKVGIDRAALAPVTTAPYKVTGFEPGQKVLLERFGDYWGEPAPFAKVSYTLIPEIASRITAMITGEVDMITNIPPDQDGIFEGNGSITLLGTVFPMYHIYCFVSSNPAVDDPKLRRALDLAIDRRAITDSLWEGKAEPAVAYQFKNYGDTLYMADKEDIKYDPEEAGKLLAESDYNGESIQIYNVSNYYTYADLAAQAVIDMWKKIGVNGELVEVDTYGAIDRKKAGIRTWSNPLYYNDPMGVIERHWAPKGEAANQKEFLPTDEYVEQFETARYSANTGERVKALRWLLDYFRAETPFIYLYKPYESLAFSNGIDYKIPYNVRAHTIGLRGGEISLKAQ
jgi:peptide/nickel transport system substrate-binding protein